LRILSIGIIFGNHKLRISGMIYNFTSKLLESAVEEFAKLPGIGKKTALRLVLHLLNEDINDVNANKTKKRN